MSDVGFALFGIAVVGVVVGAYVGGYRAGYHAATRAEMTRMLRRLRG